MLGLTLGLGFVRVSRRTVKNAYFSKIKKMGMVSEFFHTCSRNNRCSTSKLIFHLVRVNPRVRVNNNNNNFIFIKR